MNVLIEWKIGISKVKQILLSSLSSFFNFYAKLEPLFKKKNVIVILKSYDLDYIFYTR